MARCAKCFRQKDTVRGLPADLVGQQRALTDDGPRICTGCWFQIDVTLGWLEEVADVGTQNLKDPQEPPVEIQSQPDRDDTSMETP